MKNVLKKYEGNDVNFFVTKSYVTAKFDYDREKPEFHIFYIKKNSNPEAYHEGYTNLKMRKMNRIEVEYFKENMKNYDVALKNTDGAVYHLRSKPFDKTQCPSYRQLSLNL